MLCLHSRYIYTSQLGHWMYIYPCWHCIYKKPDTFQNARQSPFGFYIHKAIHFRLQDFHEMFEVGIYIQKEWHFALCDIYICKSYTLCKKQDNLRYVFIYKYLTLCITKNFIELLNFAEGGGRIIIIKQCTLCDILY